MSNELFVGQLPSEKAAQEKMYCRQIIKEITDFGVSEKQKLFLVYLLALELESVENMKKLAKFMKDNFGSEIFVSDKMQLEE